MISSMKSFYFCLAYKIYALTHEYDRHIGTMRFDFWMPLTRYVFKGTTGAYRETDQETISLQTKKNECKIIYA